MSNGRVEHWEAVHRGRDPEAVGWWEDEPRLSLELIRATGVARDTPVIDVGAGASRLVDHLLADGWTDLTVLDVSGAALDTTRARLGASAARVTWIVADVLDAALDRQYGLWHDRAVFHFLTDAGDRDRYLDQARRSVRAGGFLVVMTFAPDGPPTCSGLPVQRYSLDALVDTFVGFGLVTSREHVHVTPAGVRQQFVAAVFRRSE